jgi:hypothetical protein
MKDLSVEEKVTVKSKNLDVVAEYNKSTRKKSASFVVIGVFFLSLFIRGDSNVWLTRCRTCGCWKEYTYGAVVGGSRSD